MLGRSFEYVSESLHIVYVVVSDAAEGDVEGWNVLILFNDRAKRLGWVHSEGEILWISSEGLTFSEAREIGSDPTPGVR